MSLAEDFLILFEDNETEQSPDDFDSIEDAVEWFNKMRKFSSKTISKVSTQYSAANQAYIHLMTGIDSALADIKSGLVDRGVKKLENCRQEAKAMRAKD